MTFETEPDPSDQPTNTDRTVPETLPVQLDAGVYADELATAAYELGELNGLLDQIPDYQAIRAPSSALEATDSSRIEGTHSTVQDLFKKEAGAVTEYEDVNQLINYREALRQAEQILDNRPFNLNLIKDLHRILLRDVRGSGAIGQFRDQPVRIRRSDETEFVPVPPERVDDYMENLERYVHESDQHPLVVASLFHYQFEAIHPFQDGNGRMGRMLIPLLLVEKELLNRPVLYMSGYLERNRRSYMEHLAEVDQSGSYEDWLSFFLGAMRKQAQNTRRLVRELHELRQRTLERVASIKSPYMREVVDHLFEQPVFQKRDVPEWIEAHRTTAYRLVNRLQELDIVKKMFEDDGNTFFWFKELVLTTEGF